MTGQAHQTLGATDVGGPLPGCTMSKQGFYKASALFGRGPLTEVAPNDLAEAVDESVLAAAPFSKDALIDDLQVFDCDPGPGDDDFWGAGDFDYDDESLSEGAQGNVHVPGAAASSFCINGCWRAWGRLVLKAGTPFSKFFRTLQLKAEDQMEPDPTAPLWPMPLPYRLPCRGDALTFSDEELGLRCVVNLQVAKLNHLLLGLPESAPFRIRGHRQLTAPQWEVIERLRKLCGAWSSHPSHPSRGSWSDRGQAGTARGNP